MDWREFYESDEYAAYRQKLVEEVGTYTYSMVSLLCHKPESAQILKGALDMAYKIIGMPGRSTNDAKQQARYQEMAQQDIARIAELIVTKRMMSAL